MSSFLILPILLAIASRSQAGFYLPGCPKALKAKEIAAVPKSYLAYAPPVVAPAPATIVAQTPAPYKTSSISAPSPYFAPPRVVSPSPLVAAAPVPALAPVAAPTPLLAAVPYAAAPAFPYATYTHSNVPRTEVHNIARNYRKDSGNALKTAMVSGHGHPLIASYGLIPHGHISVNPVLPVPLS